jgi:hypothetical protein
VGRCSGDVIHARFKDNARRIHDSSVILRLGILVGFLGDFCINHSLERSLGLRPQAVLALINLKLALRPDDLSRLNVDVNLCVVMISRLATRSGMISTASRQPDSDASFSADGL